MDILKYILCIGGGLAAGAYVGYTLASRKAEEELDNRLNEVADYYRKEIDKITGDDKKKQSKKEEKPDIHNELEPKVSYTEYQNKQKDALAEAAKYQDFYKSDYDGAVEPIVAKKTPLSKEPELQSPYVEIDEKLYSETELSYDKEELHWWMGGETPVLTDSGDYIYDEYDFMNKTRDTIQARFVTDGDEMYIRNDENEIDYWVVAHEGAFEE